MAKIETAIILCSGSHNDSKTPMALAESHGEILLEKNINKLLNAGFKNILIATTDKNELFDQFLTKKKYNSSLIYTVTEREPLGSGGAVKNILLSHSIDNALVLNGDTYPHFDLKDFMQFHHLNGFTHSIALKDKKYSITDETIQFKDVKELAYLGACIVSQESFNHTHLNKFSLFDDLFILLQKDNLGAYIAKNNQCK
ncbi:MAG: sugar phosphate nucleotidyltransferase [Bacteriovoracaceae bacterium]|nr:sugar phosphate nucleotidyltransferase [Bacteriovoracaceae bacterium]